MKNALIVGLGYHPGHKLHMVAFNEMLLNLDYSVFNLFHKRYITTDEKISSISLFSLTKIDVSIIYSPSILNFLAIIYLKVFRRSNVYFYFHEPFDSIVSYRNAGFSLFRIFKLLCFDLTNVLCVLSSFTIILGSDKSLSVFKRKFRYYNRNVIKMPLIYPAIDVNESSISKKKYISYIGTIASDHAFESFFNLMISSLKDNDLQNFAFLIATSSTLSSSMINSLKEIDVSKRVRLFQGKYMTDDFINNCYYESILVWNAYTRGMQSGVLARSFLYATPVLVNKNNSNEYVMDRFNSYFISDLSDSNQFKNAILFTSRNLLYLSYNARETYNKNFNYNNYLDIF